MTLLSPAPLPATITPVGLFAKALLLSLSLGAGCDRPAPEQDKTPPLTPFQTDCFRLIQSGDTGPARIRLRQQIDAGETDSRLSFLMGMAHHWDRNYVMAATWFERAEAATPPYPPASHFHGWALYYAGQPEESRLAFHRHLNHSAESPDSLFGLGVLAIERGELDLADVYLDRAIYYHRRDAAEQKELAKALTRKAEVAEMRGFIDESIEFLKESVVLNDDLYEAHFRLARLLARRGYSDAAADAQQAGKVAKARVESQDPRPR
jgi:Tfp pilus assembly protein PilF